MNLAVDIVRVEEELLIRAFSMRGLRPTIIYSNTLYSIPEDRLSSSVVLVRNISAANSIYVAAITEASNGVAINPLRALIVGHDKILTYSTLVRNKIKIPQSIIALENSRLEDYVDDISYPIIDKPPIGSWGRLVSLVKTPTAFKEVIKHRSILANPQLRVHIIQKPANLGSDIRCLVVGDSIAACMIRKGQLGEWRSNAALGGSVIPYKPSLEVEEAALKSATLVGAEIAGVDILHDDGDYYVNEVNVVPEFKALMKATSIDISEVIASYILNKLKR
ncbi:MAG: RimK family alpha-L-glutamate ligase [Acidilobaceae archaeon]